MNEPSTKPFLYVVCAAGIAGDSGHALYDLIAVGYRLVT